MSTFSEVLEYIQQNGECTTSEVCCGLEHLDLRVVQRTLERLASIGQLKRKPLGRFFLYYTDEPIAPSETGRPVELANKALDLEARGLRRRAATVWLEAFDCAKTPQARACFALRRAKCLSGMTRGIADGAGNRWNETNIGGSW
ncbi:PerC family transcriptional regulator [Kosakonia sacchari]|uniref:PerC family transcriptional regulator n=1 Tax=Kosakonia sacchari TaxID=1158459 RepID=UPI0028A8A4E9|nr:PerC family transcriptional regulator [Kosakonia sacchari]